MIRPKETLIIFDEIQACDAALTSLKYFCEDSPEYHLAAAGSLLGVKLGSERSFPVGKVNFLYMFPMTFMEFVAAIESDKLAETIQQYCGGSEFPAILHEKFLHLLRYYLMVGGMPESVKTYIEERDLSAVRQVQNDILASFQNDFNKHAKGTDAIRIQRAWESVPLQLARENKKFKYSDIKKGGRAGEFEVALHWLESAGLIQRIHHVDSPRQPLKAYRDDAKFKLFCLDTGILAAQLQIGARVYLASDKVFADFNGAFTENFVAQELLAHGITSYYWASEHEAEIDFLTESSAGLIPLEVKAGISRKTKSLRIFEQKFRANRLLRTTARNFRVDGGIMNIPLYALGPHIKSCLSD